MLPGKLAAAAGFVLLLGAAQSPPPASQSRPCLPKAELPQPPPRPSSSSYALIVGIADYKDPELRLNYTEADAQEMYFILTDPRGGNFPPEFVHRLIGKEATRERLASELEWLTQSARPDDRVLIYFAGHGLVRGARAYLLPHDADRKDLAGTAYPMDSLASLVGRIQAQWKVLLTDACHSGVLAEASTVNQSIVGLHRSVFSLAATGVGETSRGDVRWGGGHGVFTYFVSRGLKGAADANCDGSLTTEELAAYVKTNVEQETEGHQHPTQSETASFNPRLILATPRQQTCTVRPPKFGALTISVAETKPSQPPKAIEVFVDGRSEGLVEPQRPLRLPGLVPGRYRVEGFQKGRLPESPPPVTVSPDVPVTVPLAMARPRQPHRDVPDLRARAREHYLKGNYVRASQLLEKALLLDPDNSDVALELGNAYRALGDSVKARELYERALKIDPDFVEVRVALASLQVDIGQTNEAIAHLQLAIQRHGNQPWPYYALAAAFLQKQRCEQAVVWARLATELRPDNLQPVAEAYLWLADSYRLCQDFPAAIRNYHKFLERSGEYKSGAWGKFFYWGLGNIAYGRRWRPARPDNWRDLLAYAYFGLCDSEMRRFADNGRLDHLDNAIRLGEEGVRLDPNHYHLRNELGFAYGCRAPRRKDPQDACTARMHFQAVIRIDPERPESQSARTNIARIDQEMLCP